MSGQVKARLVATLVCFLLSVAINIAAWRWIAAFVRIEEMRIPYIAMISLFLSAAFYGFSSISKRLPMLAVVAVGVFAGVVCGTIAITLSNLALGDGLQRLIVSFERDGAKAALFDVPVSLLLGSWVVGALSFCGSCLQLRRACAVKLKGLSSKPT